MLNIDKLTFRYPRRQQPVIADFSLEISDGGIYGLLGSNGAGKSTLLYLICGLLSPKSGEVTFKSINTRSRKPETLNDIFIVPEELTLPPVTLDTFVKMNAPLYPKFSYEDMQRHLATFEVKDIARYKLSSLSMGQKKKSVHVLRPCLQHISASDGRTDKRTRHTGQSRVPPLHSHLGVRR